MPSAIKQTAKIASLPIKCIFFAIRSLPHEFIAGRLLISYAGSRPNMPESLNNHVIQSIKPLPFPISFFLEEEAMVANFFN